MLLRLRVTTPRIERLGKLLLCNLIRTQFAAYRELLKVENKGKQGLPTRSTVSRLCPLLKEAPVRRRSQSVDQGRGD